jgi:DNA-binding CsgD family transcriptional regulator
VSSLSSRQLKAFSEALHRLYEPVNADDFSWRVLQVVDQLLPDSVLSFNQIDKETGKVSLQLMHRDPAEAWLARLPEVIHQNPSVAYCAAGGPELVVKISDFMTLPQLKRTDFYHDILKPNEVKYQIGMVIPVPGQIVAVAVNRDTDFTEEDRLICNLLSPHIDQAHARAEELRRLHELRRNPVPTPERLEELGVTRRESEVLHWLIQGKRDDEIAQIIGTSPRTVQKHVQNIIRQLKVENRTGAALTAVECVLRAI